jgi:hypothetical protein
MGFLIFKAIKNYSAAFGSSTAAGSSKPVLTAETLNPTLSINNLLITSIERVIARPHINVQFWLSRAHRHNFFAVTENLGIGVPSRMEIWFSHDVEFGEK